MPPEKVGSFGENTAFGRPAQPIVPAKLYVFLAPDMLPMSPERSTKVPEARTPYQGQKKAVFGPRK